MGMKLIKGKEYVEAGEVQTGGISDSTQLASGVISTSQVVDVLKSDTWSTATLTAGTVTIDTGLESPTGFSIMSRGAYFVRDLTISTSQIIAVVCSGDAAPLTAATAYLTFWAFE